MDSFLRTSLIEIKSSIHGRQRRAERAIQKKDLQKAIKHGRRQRQTQRVKGKIVTRWKYTFADITYITNEDCTQEITSYVPSLTLQRFPLTPEANAEHIRVRETMREDLSLITSHVVLVVDMSGSMRNHDVIAHKTRADAVYYSIASDFIAKQLCDARAGMSTRDVISIIEMRNEPRIIFEKEPITWVLHNKLVSHASHARPKYHGNYIPTLEAALNLLSEDAHESLSLGLMFLSDGRQSDQGPNVERRVLNAVQTVVTSLRDKLTFRAVGFGPDNFALLRQMASEMKSFGVKSTFEKSDLSSPSSLQTTLSSLGSSVTATRTSLLESKNRTVRGIKANMDNFDPNPNPIITSDKWNVYKGSVSRHELVRYEKTFTYKKRPLLHEKAVGVAIRKEPFGEGVERFAYQMWEIDAFGRPVGKPLVAKETRFREDLTEKQFHYRFCKTQKIAGNYAQKFNHRLASTPGLENAPKIEFLECFRYSFFKNGIETRVLVEEQLTPSAFDKWNNNKGGVKGKHTGKAMMTIRNFEDYDFDLEGLESDSESENELSTAVNRATTFKQEDIPQAFTHFTHMWTKRGRMICDLQGEFCPEVNTFRLTDPCIHTEEKKGWYGRTDFGKKGMYAFFKTHECNDVCKAIGIAYNN